MEHIAPGLFADTVALAGTYPQRVGMIHPFIQRPFTGGKFLKSPGRKIETSEIIKAYEEAGTYSGAARVLSRKRRTVTPGFVQLRIRRLNLIKQEFRRSNNHIYQIR